MTDWNLHDPLGWETLFGQLELAAIWILPMGMIATGLRWGARAPDDALWEQLKAAALCHTGVVLLGALILARHA